MNQEELTDLVSKLQQKTSAYKKKKGAATTNKYRNYLPRSCARALNVSQTPIKHDAIINARAYALPKGGLRPGIYKIVFL
jgi:hypothetical protein